MIAKGIQIAILGFSAGWAFFSWMYERPASIGPAILAFVVMLFEFGIQVTKEEGND